MQLDYTVTNRDTYESHDISHKTYLTTTSCNYGSTRYWFLCTHCGRRVGKLYRSDSNYYLCRHCVGYKYGSQSAGRISRMFKVNYYYSDLERMRKGIRATHYAGEPTKRYKRYLELSERMKRAMGWCSMSI